MAATVLRWADRRTEPWANGAGVTHPLAQSEGDGDGDSWRVSIAELAANAQFSRLPDIHRQLVCLGPMPIRLSVDGQSRFLPVGGITEFSGDCDVRCEVDEPSLALNVMSRNGTRPPRVQLLELLAGARQNLPQVRRGLFVVLAGIAQITSPLGTGKLTELDALDCQDTAVQLDGAGRAAFILP